MVLILAFLFCLAADALLFFVAWLIKSWLVLACAVGYGWLLLTSTVRRG